MPGDLISGVDCKRSRLNLDGYIFSDQWKSGYRAEIRRRLAADFKGWAADRAKLEEQVENMILALRADCLTVVPVRLSGPGT
jgi:hypothetical protein